MISTILVVDDDDFARHFSRVVLERAGYRIIEATEIAAAVELARADRPHIALVDFCLPDGNGIGLARQLHQEDPLLPILLVSGDTGQIEGATNPSDFTAVIQKPYSPATLLQAVVSAQAH